MDKARIRQDIWALSNEKEWHPVILAYARAVGVLKSRDNDPKHASDPTRWGFQTAVHWYDGKIHAKQKKFLNKCQHDTWYFLPWHRIYLHHFEEIVRSVIAEDPEIEEGIKQTWALPYWNYSKNAQTRMLPPAFAEQKLDGQDNPLFDATRFLNNGESLDPRVVDTTAALRPRHFVTSNFEPGFAGSKTGFVHWAQRGAGPLEVTPHDSVHGSVGVTMSQLATAPGAPIFWLHHANIDRLWQVWLASGQGRSNTTDPAFLTGQKFWFYNAQRQQVEMSVSDVLDTAGQLNYTYEDISVPGLAGEEAIPPEPDHPAQLVGAADQPVQLVGDTATVSFPIRAPGGPLQAEAEPARVYLLLDDVTSPDVPRVPYAVYLNIPDDDSSMPDEHFVGTASTFGIEQRPSRDHPEGMRLVFEITDLYRSLKARGLWSDHVSVRFVPLYVQPPAAVPEDAERVPGGAQTPGTINVGQVSVQFQ